jgi:hypothetical protein
MNTPYTYLFIRRDLTGPQQIVQASHAALEAGHRFGPHSHLVLIDITNEDDLYKAADHLEQNDIEYQMFHEPDNDTGHTAICTQPLIGDKRRPLRRYKLMKEDAPAAVSVV